MPIAAVATDDAMVNNPTAPVGEMPVRTT